MSKEDDSKDEKLRKLVELKTVLEKKIKNLEANLETLRGLLDFVNETLVSRGFKRADVAKPTSKTPILPPVLEYKTVVPLKAAAGDLLANLYMSQDSMRVVMVEDKKFSAKTPPFQQFLVERVLEKMQEKDIEAAGKDELPSDRFFSYEIVLDNDVIREIVIKNVTADRLRELKSSIHWTLEKMYEKTKTSV